MLMEMIIEPHPAQDHHPWHQKLSVLVPSPGLHIGRACEAGPSVGMRSEHDVVRHPIGERKRKKRQCVAEYKLLNKYAYSVSWQQ